MVPEISEFSYGFALTNELVGWTALNAAPIFPTLIEEGKKGGGYDVKLDLPAVPLYLQFKRSDCMVRRNAREISNWSLDLEIPFYRFSITARNLSFQHTSLVTLDDGSNLVYYAAPRFHTLSGINEAWLGQKVAQRSLFVAPNEIGLIYDDQPHHVAFDDSKTFFLSEPKELTTVSIEDIRKKVEQKLEQEERPLRENVNVWREDIRAKIDKAQKVQKEIEEEIERERIRGRIEKEQEREISDDELDSRFERPADRRVITDTLEMRRRLPPEQPPMEIRDEPELPPERRAIKELAEDARREFNAQLVLVQQADVS